MTQIALPNGTYQRSSWETGAGGTTNIHEKINTSSGDATDYITAYNDGSGSYICTLEDPTDPGTHTGHTVYFMAQRFAINTKITCKLRQGLAEIASTGELALTNDPAPYSLALSETQASSITDYDNLRIEFIVSGSNGSGSVAVYEAYLSLPGVLQSVTLASGVAEPALGSILTSANFIAYLSGLSGTEALGEPILALAAFLYQGRTEFTGEVGAVFSSVNLLVNLESAQDASWVMQPKMANGLIPTREFTLRANRGMSFTGR